MRQQPRICSRCLTGAILAGTLSASAARPQSFDCDQAKSDIEMAICRSSNLAALDVQLAGTLGKLISAQPDRRAALLSDERRWLRERDQRCKPQVAGQTLEACLTAEYSARIAELNRGASVAAKSRTAVCQLIADRYRPQAHSHPGEAPLEVLVHTPNSGVELVSKSDSVLHPSSDLVSWAAQQTPPFKLSSDMLHALQLYEQLGGGGALYKAPGIPFYSLTRVEGSMACSNSLSFVIDGGVASLVTTPGESNGDDGSCDTAARYGTVDATPVAMVQNYDYRPGMSASLDVWTWQGRQFESACEVRLQYKPHFGANTLNSWGETCAGADCNELRAAAFRLAEAAETDPETLQAQSLKTLTDPQRAQFALIAQAFDAERRDPSADNAINVPLIHRDRVYLASIGNFTIGWREYADYSVVFASLDDGKLTVRGSFAVGTWKGDVESISIAEK
jgi:uncharacterized protein